VSARSAAVSQFSRGRGGRDAYNHALGPMRLHTPPPLAFDGTVIRWRRVGGLVLAEVAYEPGQRIHRATHAHARFMLVLKGAITETGTDGDVTHGASTLLFQAAAQAHSFAVGSRGATCLVLDMDAAWICRAQAHAPVLSRDAAFRSGLLLHLAHRLYGEFRLRDEVSRLAIESLALGVMAQASRRANAVNPAPPLWVQAALTFIRLHFTGPLSLASVAQHVGVHPVHLARTFRQVYQTPFAAYVRELRIDFAREQLAGGAALSDIAAAAGFCDQSHFCRCFKRHVGLTPAAYRARVR
jgi:AraC family transcriptional regulator